MPGITVGVGAVIHFASRPSLETNWLPQSLRKHTGQPMVCFDDGFEHGGMYTPPGYDPELTYGKDCITTGLIIINPMGLSPIPATIAHEWRHHWQYLENPRVFDGIWIPVYGQGDHMEMIVDYFSYQWHEFDALRFTMSQYSCDEDGDWLIACQKAKRGLFAPRIR